MTGLLLLCMPLGLSKGPKKILIFSEMNQSFPWVLAAKYLIAGIGAVMGILSAASASIAMREMKEDFAATAEILPGRKVDSIKINISSPAHSGAVNDSNPTQIVRPNMAAAAAESLLPITEESANGVIETSFP